MYNLSKKYIYLSEYFNPTPIELIYRGFKGKLFKRLYQRAMEIISQNEVDRLWISLTEDQKRKVIVIIQTGFLFKVKLN